MLQTHDFKTFAVFPYFLGSNLEIDPQDKLFFEQIN
jgi:hypothetical protein